MKKLLTSAVLAAIFLSTSAALVYADGSIGPNPKSQKLGDLACTTDQIAKFNGAYWACADDEVGSGGEPGWVLKDNNGDFIGPISIDNSTSSNVTINFDGDWVVITARPDELLSNASIYFEGEGCSGNAYVQPFTVEDLSFWRLLLIAFDAGGARVVYEPIGDAVSFTQQSYIDRFGDCQPFAGETTGYPVESTGVDLHEVYPPPYTAAYE